MRQPKARWRRSKLRTESELEAGDRIPESGARRYRSGVIEVRPILEEIAALRQVAHVQDRLSKRPQQQ